MENKFGNELWPISCSYGIKYIDHPFNRDKPEDHIMYIQHLKKVHITK